MIGIVSMLSISDILRKTSKPSIVSVQPEILSENVTVEKHEEPIQSEGNRFIIHRFWTSKISPLNRKVITSFQSVFRTQTRARVIIWTFPETLDELAKDTKALNTCTSTLEIRPITDLLRMLQASTNPLLRKCIPAFEGGLTNIVGFSDVLRFIALYFYGGIYADTDVIFMRSVRDLIGLSFAYKWDINVENFNTAVMGLPMHSIVPLKVIRHFNNCNADVFFPWAIRETLTCSVGGCKELTMMPTALFSPTSSSSSNWFWNTDKLLGTTPDWFFNAERPFELDSFFPGAYTFHWHNRWDFPIHEESSFIDLERLNQGCDARTPCKQVFVDLGGYTGDTLKLYGSTTYDEIYVFEIDMGKVATILDRLNGQLAHIKPITTVINAAAWNEDKVLKVTLTGHNDGRVASNGNVDILAYDMGAWFDRTIATPACVLLKMDIEGAEVQALESMDRARVFTHVTHLIIEWHDWLMPEVAEAKNRLVDMLKRYGLVYQYATLDDQLDRKYMPGEPWPVNHCDSHYLRAQA